MTEQLIHVEIRKAEIGIRTFGVQPAPKGRPAIARGVSRWTSCDGKFSKPQRGDRVQDSGFRVQGPEEVSRPVGTRMSEAARFPFSVFRPRPNHKSQIPNPKSPRGGFTLIELLVTIVVIAFLAGIMLGALNSARTTARAAKTKSLITRLHAVMMDKYMSYQTRRVPITTGGLTRTQAATQRLNALRDLMRMEMPDRWSDVIDNPLVTGVDRPAVSYAYKAAYDVADDWANGDSDREQLVADNGAAECLYLIVMSIPDAADKFRGTDIGDSDGDGLLEFHDGWDQPIRLIRWPAGYYFDSASTIFTADTLLQSNDPSTHPDPFDPQRVLASQGGYALYPLIYSGGADKQYDINIGLKSDKKTTYAYELDASNDINPYATDGLGNLIGQPVSHTNPANVGEYHYDNITNHNIEAR